MHANPPAIHDSYDYHKPSESKLQLIRPCGGATDNDGITWEVSGDFYAYPWEDINALQKKYSRWRPSVNPQSMVLIGYGMPFPTQDELSPGAFEEYKRLMNVSHIKYVYKEMHQYITREYNEDQQKINP